MKIKIAKRLFFFILLLSVIALSSCGSAIPADTTDTGTAEAATEAGIITETDTESETEAEAEDEEKVLFGLTQKEADMRFSEILDGLFTGKTKEVKDNETVIGLDFNMHFPDFVYVDGQYRAYYICYRTNTGKGGVGLAISNDGVDFTDMGCVIQPDADYDMNGAYFAGAWYDKEDGKTYVAYECKGGEKTSYGTLENVALAVSADGVDFEKEGVIIKRDQRPWQSANVGTPDLYKDGDTWYVFFHGFDYKTCQIGVAYGKDLHELTMVKNPIIPTKKNTLWSGTTGRRDIIYVGGWYYMVYEISTEQPYDSACWTHKFARSKDLIKWETTGDPLLRQTDDNGAEIHGFGYDGPCFCIIGDHIYVYYRSYQNSTARAELVLPAAD
ncbi:MAG: hypothetical protein J5879_01060 [Clostridia bacterium]|nr:hypothetical protein [Clostridia bacterium]